MLGGCSLALVRAKLADLVVVLAAQGAIGLKSLCIGLDMVLEEGPVGSNGGCRVEDRDGLVGRRLVRQSDLWGFDRGMAGHAAVVPLVGAHLDDCVC